MNVPDWFKNFVDSSMGSDGNPDMGKLIGNMPKFGAEFQTLETDMDAKMKAASLKKIRIK